MRKTEKGRKHLEEAENKQNEFYEAKLKKDHGDPESGRKEDDKGETMEVDESQKAAAGTLSPFLLSPPLRCTLRTPIRTRVFPVFEFN